jgi:hypothetical protein
MNMIAAGAAALLALQSTPGPPVQCIPAQQVADLAIVMMPAIVDAAQERCRPHLANGFLSSPGAAAMSERFRAAGAGRRGSAARAVHAMAGAPAPRAVPADVVLTVATTGFIGRAFASVDAPRCGRIQSLLGALAPLPPENVGQALAAIAALAAADDADNRRGSNMAPVCAA